jgi:hypothetical protein
MDAEDIHFAAARIDKMQHTLVYRIEESLPIERTAFKYDGKS